MPLDQPTMTPEAIDQTRCPLCGENNACGAARGAGTCWCFSSPIPEEVLERVPPEQRNLACVCERCASGRRSPVEAQAVIDPLTRDR